MTEWSTLPFIDYLDAVDALLEQCISRTSTQDELEEIAAAQEAGDNPEACTAYLIDL